MRICRLERSNCDCKDMKFTTAHEKRRHMLLFHSNKKYFPCSECNFVSKQQRVVDHHYRHYHGLPGQEEVCDLCFKTFKSKNHLRIHGFNHEVFTSPYIKRISIFLKININLIFIHSSIIISFWFLLYSATCVKSVILK